MVCSNGGERVKHEASIVSCVSEKKQENKPKTPVYIRPSRSFLISFPSQDPEKLRRKPRPGVKIVYRKKLELHKMKWRCFNNPRNIGTPLSLVENHTAADSGAGEMKQCQVRKTKNPPPKSYTVNGRDGQDRSGNITQSRMRRRFALKKHYTVIEH